MALSIIVTGDGSHSLLNDSLQETYHSVHGALRESRHVFIDAGMAYWLNQSRAMEMSVFEVGFGTGLNAWLAWGFAKQNNVALSYTSIESTPLERGIWSKLNYVEGDEASQEFAKLHDCAWNTTVTIDHQFELQKIHGSLEDVNLEAGSADVLFFDAFAPSKQPEMWSLRILEKCIASLRPRGVFVTYCAKGQLKRDLKTLNLITETLPGPPGTKEMVRASKR